jgi:hypothetical protein
MEGLELDESLPEDMPQLFYSRLGSLLRSGKYAERIEPFLNVFPKEKWVITLGPCSLSITGHSSTYEVDVWLA